MPACQIPGRDQNVALTDLASPAMRLEQILGHPLAGPPGQVGPNSGLVTADHLDKGFLVAGQ